MSRPYSDNLDLTPGQQGLLFAALNSKKSSPMQNNNQSFSSSNKRTASQGATFNTSAMSDFSGTMPGSGHLDFDDESPYLDFDLDAEADDSFDFARNGQLFGDLPGDDSNGDDDSQENGKADLHDKRKSVGDSDSAEQGEAKRREGEDKQAKKPGRKPLTSEPTSKRKAQNRAAQRAFRERKEQHLKDLETKVEDLEKVSEATNHENGMLRAQVERLNIELKEYRKRLSWMSSNGLGRTVPSTAPTKSVAPPTQNDFQFEFPKFGDLPVTNIFGNPTSQKPQATTPGRATTLPNTSANLPAQIGNASRSMSGTNSQAQSQRQTSMSASPLNKGLTASPQPQQRQQPADGLSALFSPSLLQTTKPLNNGYFPRQNTSSTSRTSRNSYDNVLGNVPGLYSNSSGSNSDSPGSSSESHQQNSSIGTSPEPSLHSPANKLNDFNLNPINENQLPDTFGNFTFDPNFDMNGINWMAQQNGGGFDPVLFGDYRESQDNVLSQDFGSFFNDAYPLPDLGSPSHNFNELNTNTEMPKNNLMQRVESAQAGPDVGKVTETEKPMTCNKIWDRLQSMEKFRNGEIDIDNLCSELRAKARCSEGGAVVNSKDVDKILGASK